MTSSSAQKDLAFHPVVTTAPSIVGSWRITAKFRTFDPVTKIFRPLAGARVVLISSDGLFSLLGMTDQYGILNGFDPPHAPLIVSSQDMIPGTSFHFEVVGTSANKTDNLTALKYREAGTLINFPITKWSTEGWKEPEGHKGDFILGGVSGGWAWFTVGCFIDVDLKFVRGSGKKAPYPENIDLKLVAATNPPLDLSIAPGGRLCAVFYDIVRLSAIEVLGFFNAKEIPALPAVQTITKLTGHVSITTPAGVATPVPSCEGEALGLAKIPAVTSIALYTAQGVIGYPAELKDPNSPRLVYTAYNNNIQTTFQQLTPAQKKVVYFNWFLEFAAYRNLFFRAMKYLLGQSGQVPWNGMNALDLVVDDAAGGAYALGNTITAHLEFILKPRDDVCIHEMAHAFSNQYFTNPSSLINYPIPDTNNHYISSYSNEVFAFQEGFAQFIASFFMDPVDAYFLEPGADWRKIYTYQTGPNPVWLGFSKTVLTQQEAHLGFCLEGALSGSLSSLWADKIWDSRTLKTGFERCWVQDPAGDGTLNPTAQTAPNHWILDTTLQRKLGYYIFDAIADAAKNTPDGRVAGRISTRRIIDQVQKRATTAPLPGGPNWAALSPVFAGFGENNDFHISTITPSGGAELLVVRSNPATLEYRFPNNVVLTLARLTGSVLQLNGIRIPSTLAATLMQGATAVATASGIVVTSEYQAQVTFSVADLTGVPILAGSPFDLLFETATTPNKVILFKGVAVT